ncbi:hypothetical protein F4809DRAFT_460924 [Biscogniauxia mediterranea]|nr:hypothetical protein F4809DRAFT_460924 [Biscogniauxia mediterranea]
MSKSVLVTLCSWPILRALRKVIRACTLRRGHTIAYHVAVDDVNRDLQSLGFETTNGNGDDRVLAGPAEGFRSLISPGYAAHLSPPKERDGGTAHQPPQESRQSIVVIIKTHLRVLI